MNAGKFRHRIRIEANTPTEDSYGDTVDAWGKVADWWADVRPLRANEVTEAQRFQGRISHKIAMHYYEGLTSEHRIVYAGRVFHIDGVVNVDERNRVHEVMAMEEV